MNGFDLHHVAIAVHDVEPVLDALVGGLGATLIMGERMPGFEFVVARVGDARRGMNFEVLQPWEPERDDFLARFLDECGEGPHHLSFMVCDLPETVADLGQMSLPLRRVSTHWPPWQEAFIPPACGHGTVIQVAGSSVTYPPMDEQLAAARAGTLLELPVAERGSERLWWHGRLPQRPPVSLDCVELRTRDPLGAEALFGDLLRGRASARGPDWVEYVWPSGSRLRVVESADAGIHHAELGGPAEVTELGGLPFTAGGGR